MRFKDKAALVTGGSSGVGRAVVKALIAEGASVGVVGRDPATLEATVDLFVGSPGIARAVVADVTLAAGCEQAVQSARDGLGGLDLLVNAAGVLRTGPLPDCSEADWDLLFDTHPKACFLTMKHAIPLMQQRGGGAIVNVASVFAYAAERFTAPYSASKAAVVALSRMAGVDHAADGIRVNCVAPGPMRTSMLETHMAPLRDDMREERFATLGARQPIGRLIKPDEVAELVLYLLSDAAAGITASCITIDGGRLAMLGSAER